MPAVCGLTTSVIQCFLLRVACLAEEMFIDYKRGTEGKKFRTGFSFFYASSFGKDPKRVFMPESLNT
jgi:hypothetical protein